MSFREALWNRRGYFTVSATVFVLDQLTKVAAHGWLRGIPGNCVDPPGMRGANTSCVEIIPGIFNLAYSRNPGALFGTFRDWGDPWRTIVLTAVPVLAVALITVFLAKTDEPDRSTLFGLSLILGGAVGNLVDRVVRGEVVDFLDVYASQDWMPTFAAWLRDSSFIHSNHWPTFNLADSAIVVGVGLLLLDVVRPDRRPG